MVQLTDNGILRLKRDGTRAETRFRLSAKRTSPFKSTGASVQSTAVSRGVRISGSNAGYTTFRGSVKSTGYPLHSPVSPSIPLPCVTVCHQVSTGLYPGCVVLVSAASFHLEQAYSRTCFDDRTSLRPVQYLCVCSRTLSAFETMQRRLVGQWSYGRDEGQKLKY